MYLIIIIIIIINLIAFAFVIGFTFSRGLDSSSCSQCISLLKMLAEQGRTIACTIHQPSALIFEMFAKVYALADGYCIYEGPTKDLVPYMSEKGLKCPVYHNPADFRKGH